MSNHDDEKALELLEKAVYKAQESLEITKQFQPFLMLLTDTGEIEMYENNIEDATESYEYLEQKLTIHIAKGNVNIMILAVDTMIPENISKGIPTGIRIHLEEKSQVDKKIGARFIYVPYELCKSKESDLYVKLHTPLPVGFPAEYIR